MQLLPSDDQKPRLGYPDDFQRHYQRVYLNAFTLDAGATINRSSVTRYVDAQGCIRSVHQNPARIWQLKKLPIRWTDLDFIGIDNSVGGCDV